MRRAHQTHNLGKPVALWFVTEEKTPFKILNINPGNEDRLIKKPLPGHKPRYATVHGRAI
jgi:hypothetical protein